MKRPEITENNRQERMHVYCQAKEMAERVLRVINRVLDGETETTACLQEDVDKRWIRRFVRDNISIKRRKNEPDTMVRIGLKDWICWQDEFLTQLIGEECYAPKDFDQAYDECVAEACTEEEQEVLCLRFQEALTLREIGEKIGKSCERVRQIESKAMRKLRYPSRRLSLMYGKEYRDLMAEIKTAQAEYDKTRMARMQELKEEQKAATRKLGEKLDQIHEKTEFLVTADSSQFPDPVSEILVSNLGLSVRAMNALSCPRFQDGRRGAIRHGMPIGTVGQLSKLSHEELCSIRNLGKGTVKEIEDALKEQFGIIIGPAEYPQVNKGSRPVA